MSTELRDVPFSSSGNKVCIHVRTPILDGLSKVEAEAIRFLNYGVKFQVTISDKIHAVFVPMSNILEIRQTEDVPSEPPPSTTDTIPDPRKGGKPNG